MSGTDRLYAAGGYIRWNTQKRGCSYLYCRPIWPPAAVVLSTYIHQAGPYRMETVFRSFFFFSRNFSSDHVETARCQPSRPTCDLMRWRRLGKQRLADYIFIYDALVAYFGCPQQRTPKRKQKAKVLSCAHRCGKKNSEPRPQAATDLNDSI